MTLNVYFIVSLIIINAIFIKQFIFLVLFLFILFFSFLVYLLSLACAGCVQNWWPAIQKLFLFAPSIFNRIHNGIRNQHLPTLVTRGIIFRVDNGEREARVSSNSIYTLIVPRKIIPLAPRVTFTDPSRKNIYKWPFIIGGCYFSYSSCFLKNNDAANLICL